VYVYIYSHDSDSAYTPADRMVLARVEKDEIRRREAYEFFVRVDGAGGAVWSKDIDKRGAVFENPGKCYRSGISYNPGLKRYHWVQTVYGEEDMRFAGGLGIFEAGEPWGAVADGILYGEVGRRAGRDEQLSLEMDGK